MSLPTSALMGSLGVIDLSDNEDGEDEGEENYIENGDSIDNSTKVESNKVVTKLSDVVSI